MTDIAGQHNADLAKSAARILKSNTYRDLSMVWVTPSPTGQLHMQPVFQSWMGIARPLNQKFCALGIANGEVGEAYNAAVEMILRDEIKWKYMLTVEHDNMPPRDGILRLVENIDKYDAIGGLYWMKGENGTAMIYGDPSVPGSFIPQVPRENAIQECNGLAMGFTIFNMDMFRKLPAPWFKTEQHENGQTDEIGQDLYFFKKAGEAGFKFACDTRVKVGHLDFTTGKVW